MRNDHKIKRGKFPGFVRVVKRMESRGKGKDMEKGEKKKEGEPKDRGIEKHAIKV